MNFWYLQKNEKLEKMKIKMETKPKIILEK